MEGTTACGRGAGSTGGGVWFWVGGWMGSEWGRLSSQIVHAIPHSMLMTVTLASKGRLLARPGPLLTWPAAHLAHTQHAHDIGVKHLLDLAQRLLHQRPDAAQACGGGPGGSGGRAFGASVPLWRPGACPVQPDLLHRRHLSGHLAK